MHFVSRRKRVYPTCKGGQKAGIWMEAMNQAPANMEFY